MRHADARQMSLTYTRRVDAARMYVDAPQTTDMLMPRYPEHANVVQMGETVQTVEPGVKSELSDS